MAQLAIATPTNPRPTVNFRSPGPAADSPAGAQTSSTPSLTFAQQALLAGAIDNFPEFRGAGIGIFADGKYQSLRNSNHATGLRTVIVLEEIPRSATGASTTAPSPHLGREIFGAVISCGGAVASGAAAGAETLSAPITMGSSAALLFVTVPVASASALQCGLSMGRVSNSIFAPENNQNLDSAEWFNKTSTVLDAISLLDTARGAGDAIRFAVQWKRATGRPSIEILKSMSHIERKRLAEEIGRYTTQPATRKQFLSLVRSGKLSKILTQREVNGILREKLLTAVSGVLAVGGSALPKNVSSSSGLVNEFLVYILQEK
jgi:hypothetical protein